MRKGPDLVRISPGDSCLVRAIAPRDARFRPRPPQWPPLASALSRDFPFGFMFWVNCGIGWSRRIEICSVLGLNLSFGAPEGHRHVICGYWGRHRRGSRRNSWPLRTLRPKHLRLDCTEGGMGLIREPAPEGAVCRLHTGSPGTTSGVPPPRPVGRSPGGRDGRPLPRS